MDGGDIYRIGFWITWVIVFLAVWIACSTEGIIGFCLGWIPAVIIAYIAAFVWPLVWIGVYWIATKLWN